MRLKPTRYVLFFTAATVFCSVCNAAPKSGKTESGSANVGTSATQGISTTSKIIPIGSPATSVPRVVSGKVTIGALVPQNVRPANIVFYADGKKIGSTKSRPFRLQNWDTASLPDGEHIFKVEALSADGSVAWSSETKVIVNNKNAGISVVSPQESKPAPNQPAAAPTTVRAPATANPPKMEIFRSQRYGFSISYPSGWSVADLTSKMKPKWPGGFWFAFSPNSADRGITMNLRHRKEPSPVNAESFSKNPENSYVNIWQRTEVNGKEAFRTTQGSPQAKRLIHRCIILDGQSVWMMNCIDTTGSTSDKSRMYFDAFVNSLQMTQPTSPAVKGKANQIFKDKKPAPKPAPAEEVPTEAEDHNLIPISE